MAVGTPLDVKIDALVKYRDGDISVIAAAELAGVHQTTFSKWLRQVRSGEIELPEPTSNGHNEDDSVGNGVAVVDPPKPVGDVQLAAPPNVLVYQDEVVRHLNEVGAKVDALLETESASVGELTERISELEQEKAILAQRVAVLERERDDYRTQRDEALREAEVWLDGLRLALDIRQGEQIAKNVG